MLILELSRTEGAEQGVNGLWVTAARSYMDAAPVQAKAKKLMCSSV
jgi:hypothetical protein